MLLIPGTAVNTRDSPKMSFQADWSLISYLLGGIIFVASSALIFYRIHHCRPSMLKAGYARQGRDTTYNWNLIMTVIVRCSSFAGGILLVSNVIIFLITGSWYVDSRSIGILTMGFVILLFQSFDRFVTSIMNKTK